MLDPIPSKLLKEVLPEVIDPLLAIINSSLAVIKPLIKKPQLDPKDLVNYRPISNLPFLSKILEKVVSSQLYSFLEKNYICEDFQSGFRPYHSTETALIRVTNDLLLSSDRGCISLLVIIGVHLPSLQDLYYSRVKKRAGNIITDPSHPGHDLLRFSLQADATDLCALEHLGIKTVFSPMPSPS